jgi:hypothetical protein
MNTEQLYAGAARRVVNPALGTRQTGFRLFGNPVQAIESDLTATALVLAGRGTKVVIVGIDLSIIGIDLSLHGWRPGQVIREEVAEALGIPVEHVMLNTSHDHAGVALPDYGPDSDEQLALKERFRQTLARGIVEAAVEADGRLQEARLGTGWGRSDIGVYRREERDGRLVLGEVPSHPIDDSVGVIRIDDLDGNPIAVVFRFSAHPVTMGGRSMVVSSDFPGPARTVVETHLGSLALFLQGCQGNLNTRVGIGYEIDCRDTKDRVGLQLGGEVLRVAAGIRTNTRAGERRQLGNIPNILFTPWEPVESGGCSHLAAEEVAVPLDYVELPSAERAAEIRSHWAAEVERRRHTDALEWELRVAEKNEQWAGVLCDAVEREHPTCDLYLQAIRVNDVLLLGMNSETFFETGLEIRERSPLPDTFVLAVTNGTIGYLPRAQDYPQGGWSLDETYAVPDMIFQVHPHPVALHPSSERRAVDGALGLLRRLAP